MGIEAIAAAVHEEKTTLEDVYEPFLLQSGFLDRTARGRQATIRAYEYFGTAHDLFSPGQKET